MRILVVGDSWASAREADTGLDAGWPVFLGIPPELQQGVSGSTAQQWAADCDGWLSQARSTPSDALVVSLLGNDLFKSLSDFVITFREVFSGLRALRFVVKRLRRPLTVVLLYANPFCGVGNGVVRTFSGIGVALLNIAIRCACFGLDVVFADTSRWLTKDHFDGHDIHPVRAGHEVIARKINELFSEIGRANKE